MLELNSEERKAADRLFDKAIVIDALGGVLPYRLAFSCVPITAMNVTIAPPHANFVQTLRAMYTYFTYLEALTDKALLIKSVSEIYIAKESGKLGILFGLQGASSLEGDLTFLTILHQLGLRIMSLTYNEHNVLGDGCMELHDRGLTHFGKQVVREMNRLGIVLDLSHSSEKTTLDAMEVTAKPPVFSHSNPYALTPSPRCITDEQIKAAAKLGGSIGISVYSPMCYTNPKLQPTLSDFLDRIDYVVQMCGIEHVGIGTDIFEYEDEDPILWRAITKRRYPEMVKDFERENIYVDGFRHHAEVINVVYGLKKRGYNDEDIEKVLGKNFLRVFKENF